MPGLRNDGLDSLPSDPPAIFKGDLGKGGWSNADLARQAAFLGLLGADWAQTRTISKNPGLWHENNPILGEHPSTGRVNNYFALTALGHSLLMDAIPSAYRKYAQYLSIGVEGSQARANKMIGIGGTF